MTWSQTRTGKRFDFDDIENAPIDLYDIAHSLSMQCRFGGHCSEFYSVAEHSVLVSEYVWSCGGTREQQVDGLLHDAAEAYIGDIVTPIKIAYPEIKGLESRIMARIRSVFGLPPEQDPLVTEGDRRVLASEVLRLMDPHPPADWAPFPLVTWPGCAIDCYPPAQARRVFLETAKGLDLV